MFRRGFTVAGLVAAALFGSAIPASASATPSAVSCPRIVAHFDVAKWSAPEVLRGLCGHGECGRLVIAVGRLLGVLLFLFVSLDPGHQVLEVGRGEPPSERPGGRVIAPLEGDEAVFDLVKAGEIVRCEDFALNDREVTET